MPSRLELRTPKAASSQWPVAAALVEIQFDHAQFDGALAYFIGAQFTGGPVDFSKVKDQPGTRTTA
jgi:hypothetical protein